MCYTNILQILDLSARFRCLQQTVTDGRSDRDRRRSLHLQSGADGRLFRSVLYGRGGGQYYDRMLDLYQGDEERRTEAVRSFLHEAAQIPGIYVPSLYEVAYQEDGTIAAYDTGMMRKSPADCDQADRDGYDGCLSIRRSRWFRLSKPRRTVWCWRFSAAVSAAAVSARQEWCTVRCAESESWRR